MDYHHFGPDMFPEMQSFVPYYYGTQLAPGGTEFSCNSCRRHRLTRTHTYEMLMFKIFSIWRYCSEEFRLYKIIIQSLEWMYLSGLHKVSKEALGLPVEPSFIMDTMKRISTKTYGRFVNRMKNQIPVLYITHF